MTITLRHIALSVGLLGLAFGLVACGSSSSDGASSPYADEVAEAWAPALEARDQVAEQAEVAYSERTRISSLGASDDAIDSLDQVAASVAAIDPPAKYEDDHARLEAMVREVQRQLRLRRTAYASDRVGDAAIAEMRLFVAVSAAAVEVDPEICRTILDPDDAVCEAAPSGEEAYETRLLGAFQRFAAGFGPRVGGVPRIGTDEEIVAYLDVIQPEVVALLRTTRDEVASLSPDEEDQEDHALLEAYVVDTLAISEEITAAAAEGDADRLRDLFAESGRPLQRTEAELSPDARERMAFLFPGG